MESGNLDEVVRRLEYSEVDCTYESIFDFEYSPFTKSKLKAGKSLKREFHNGKGKHFFLLTHINKSLISYKTLKILLKMINYEKFLKDSIIFDEFKDEKSKIGLNKILA